MSNPVIVIPAFKRPDSLRRLLFSLSNAIFKTHPLLIITIDGGGSKEVIQVAQDFDWPGEKQVIVHQENKGLKEHILYCGDLSQKYDCVIVIEEDLLVSPYFYQYATKAVDFYYMDDEIASISLYNYEYIEDVDLPFRPLHNGKSTYFIQTASSLGQVWTKKQWRKFKDWYANNQDWDSKDINLPDNVRHWPERSWKKYFIKYVVYANKYVVFPYTSYSTNFGEIGANEGYRNNNHQTNLTIGINTDFAKLEESLVKYDVFFQLENSAINNLSRNIKINDDITIDLFANKSIELISTEYVLTTRRCYNPIQSFSLELYPPELNIINNIKGDLIHLCRTSDVDFNSTLPFEGIQYFLKLTKANIHKIQIELPPLRIQISNQIKYWFTKSFLKK
jgi:hypothetical protein